MQITKTKDEKKPNMDCVNLLTSVLIYYPEISKISIEPDEKIYIKIEDNGLGIKKEELPHLFDRFFRSENVRNKDIDGSGIGLSIAKVISESLKYKLKVDSEYGKWTKFEIIIPIDED